MTIGEVLIEGKKRLSLPCSTACISTPALDASLLLSEVLQLSRANLTLKSNETASETDEKKYYKLLERRRSGECIAYILGRKEFRSLDFTVSPDVLVPRPDTEILVEAALEYIDLLKGKTGESISVLDLCTGSGAIAISLLNECPFITISASDISKPALVIAALNAEKIFPNTVSEHEAKQEKSAQKIKFIHSDLFTDITGKFNIIVSNPPYVPSGILTSLAPEVHLEPKLALDGGEDGLDLIRIIIAKAKTHLVIGGVLLLEADPAQMRSIETIFENNNFCRIKIYKDLAGLDRIIAADFAGTT